MCIKLPLHLMKQNWFWEEDKLSEVRVVPVEYKGNTVCKGILHIYRSVLAWGIPENRSGRGPRRSVSLSPAPRQDKLYINHS